MKYQLRRTSPISCDHATMNRQYAEPHSSPIRSAYQAIALGIRATNELLAPQEITRRAYRTAPKNPAFNPILTGSLRKKSKTLIYRQPSYNDSP